MARKKSVVERAQRLLAAYRETCNISESCKRAGIDRKTHYNWLEKHPKYKEAFESTRTIAAQTLEALAIERATVGWTDDIYYQGQRCGTVQRYDSGLMQFLLRGAMPEKYNSPQRQELSGPQGAPVQAKIEIVFVRPGETT